MEKVSFPLLGCLISLACIIIVVLGIIYLPQVMAWVGGVIVLWACFDYRSARRQYIDSIKNEELD